MKRRPRRIVPAVLVATALGALAVLVAVTLVQRLTGTHELVSYDSVATRLHTTAWDSAWVLAGGIVAVVLGLLLLAAALLPGRAVVVPLEAEDEVEAGITRRSLRHAIADAAAGVDGLDRARVRLRAKKIRVSGHTHHTAPKTAEDIGVAVGARLDRIRPAGTPRLRTSLRAITPGGTR
ncbi:DUF6286 domain-containing protein [Nocardia thailandica]|uniref:DUF6286 domain-containing protein n=1 Tax=Nocardia thailandica TaxID=257275 RepID=UPI0002FE3DD9|nr:DUF6286 domain-containing protein [Nocardia thailandica]